MRHAFEIPKKSVMADEKPPSRRQPTKGQQFFVTPRKSKLEWIIQDQFGWKGSKIVKECRNQ